DADGSPVATGSRPVEQARQIVTRGRAPADPDLAATDLHRALAQERRPGRITLGMSVEDHVTVAEFLGTPGIQERGVRDDVDRTIAAIPERLGVESRPGQSPGVLLGASVGTEDQEEAVAKGLLERTHPMGAFV